MKTLTLVIPVYNESERLDKVFRSLSRGLKLSDVVINSVIIVNDGSTDTTAEIIKKKIPQLSKKTGISIQLISYTKNRGKGYAVQRGMKKATSDYALLMDADMSTPLSELHKFTADMNNNKPVIIGTRKTQEAAITKAQPLYRQYMGKVFTLLSQLILNTWVSDFTCGFKLFNKQSRKEIFEKAQIERWGYDAEILFLAKLYNYSITEIPVSWHNDERSRVHVVQDALQSLQELLQIRFCQLRGEYTEQSTSKTTSLAKIPAVLMQIFL